MVTPASAEKKAKLQIDKPSPSADELIFYYREMLHIRRFEEKAAQLYGMGLIGGFCHLYIGQEAIIVGLQSCVKKGDQSITTYRDHAHMLAAGTPPENIFAELLGHETGCSRGKGGSMHMFDIERGCYGGHGIVGAHVPVGTGLAFANKYKETDNVCLTYFGDGATNQGQVYESFNMASLWGLPIVYVIENNEYAMGTSIIRSSANTELFKRGESFGINGYQFDGMNILEVIKAGRMAVEHTRSGKGPIILEMKTYRYRGHSMSDPAKYRSKEEVSKVKDERDPIETLKKIIIDENYASLEDLKKIDKGIREEIAKAVDIAKTASEPDASELYEDVYA